jgi:hypothetical protein
MIKKLALFTALFFFSMTSFLWAQNRRYVTEQRFIQRLVWVGDEYAFRYEVVIERNEGEGYREFKRDFTTLSALVISLPLGNYRYHVIPYDYLDQPGEASEWMMLDVVAPPVVPDETPEQSAPREPKKQNVIVGVAWVPLYPINGRMQEIFGHEFFSSAATFRLGFIYNNYKGANPGLEVAASWYTLDKFQDDASIRVQAGATMLNIIMQAWLSSEKAAFMFRTGGGYVFQFSEVDTGHRSYSIGSVIPQMSAEASFLWMALERFYLETGVGINYLISQDSSFMCFRPWIGFGWQF